MNSALGSVEDAESTAIPRRIFLGRGLGESRRNQPFRRQDGIGSSLYDVSGREWEHTPVDRSGSAPVQSRRRRMILRKGASVRVGVERWPISSPFN